LRIAILDYRVEPTNPAGGCHWRLLKDLNSQHEFTVFSVTFENPAPSRIRWVRIPAPRRPLALLFVVYHLIAPWYFRRFCRRERIQFDKVQMIESNFGFADISYVHFCHKFYLQRVRQARGSSMFRSFFRWLDHRLHALGERLVYDRVPCFVVPSIGLKKEIEGEYPTTKGRVRVIHNPIDISRFQPPPSFDREAFRRTLKLQPTDCVCIFVALGHFERKGLPALLQAISKIGEHSLQLIVVGGNASGLAPYRKQVESQGLGAQVRFVGNQRDVRPFLWAGDAFILPSSYETFSLVTFEAAAAGLPLLAARNSGIEEILRDGQNGFAIGTASSQIVIGLQALLRLSPSERNLMGANAREAVRGYSENSFIDSWRAVYDFSTAL
jgi:glycosyltransferase involved in cell wall biosynthesis